MTVKTKGGMRASRSTRKKKAAVAVPESATSKAESIQTQLIGLSGGRQRQTLPLNANVIGMLPWAFLPRRQYQDLDLTTIVPGSFSPQQMLEVLADAHPEVGLALSNQLRLISADWKYEVRTPDNTKEDTAGKAALDHFLATKVNANWGGFQAILHQWAMSVALDGACSGETIPNDDVTDVLDIVAVQPWTIYFQRDIEQNYVAYQWQPMLAAAGASYYNSGDQHTPDPHAAAPKNAELLLMQALDHGGFRKLNTITFGYVPFDPHTDDPYGRMPFASIMQIIIFDAQLMKDLRQWSHINAFGRIDINISFEDVEKMMAPATRNDAEQRAAFLNKYLADIVTAYNTLNPDDTFVHWDNVKVGNSDSSGKTFQIDNLIKVIERRMFRALKQLPILMGSNEGTTETWGTLQMEVYALSVAAQQKCISALASRLLTAALRIMGFNCQVIFEFEKLRASDRIKEAAATKLEDLIAINRRDQGWISQDEASIQRTGSKAVAPPPNPDPVNAAGQPDAAAGETGEVNVEPAQQRAAQNYAQPGGVARLAQRAKDEANDPATYTGVMVGHFLKAADAQQLVITDGLPADSLHMTLFFLGDGADFASSDRAKLHKLMQDWATTIAPFPATIGGIGRFTNVPDGQPTPVYAAVDSPALTRVREELQGIIEQAGLAQSIDTTHGFTPHITLAYIDADADMPVIDLPDLTISIDTLTLAVGGVHYDVLLSGGDNAERSQQDEHAEWNELQWAFNRLMLDLVMARANDNHTKWRPPSAQRVTLEDKLSAELAARFKAQTVSRDLVKRIIATHTNRSILIRASHTHPILKDACAALIEAQDTHLRVQLTSDEREALRTSITRLLAEDIPDEDQALVDLLNGYATDAFNLGGQDALDYSNLDGTFSLTNETIMARLLSGVTDRAADQQATTRNQIATQIIDGLQGDDSLDTITGDIRSTLDGMATARADSLANYETSLNYFDGSFTTWGKNGLEEKVWATDSDPDPYAGATGATPCRDNSYAGAIGIDEEFPSGDQYPPAHGLCHCDCVPSGDPSESAQANPWTGD